jgi:hypothetical protein
MSKAVLDNLKAYLDSREKAAIDAGMVPTPPAKRAAEHFKWLALYQVKGLSLTAIARQCRESECDLERERKKIAAGVEDAGQRVAASEWPRWRRSYAKGGRPRKPAIDG